MSDLQIYPATDQQRRTYDFDDFLFYEPEGSPFIKDLPTSNEVGLSGEALTKKETRKNKVTPYPTKNLLPCLMKPHREFIKRKVKDVEKNQELRKILRKEKVSKEAYIVLYTHPLLRDYWPEMFASKYLYQQLMLSRTSQQQRKIFQSKIKHFQKAYQRKEFIGNLIDS